MKQESDTKQKILDAAQHLFAREGFKGTSLRAITNRAGVNLAAINYHFGSKEALLKAILERHLIPLNKVRIERLEKVRDSARQVGRRPSVRNLLMAFLEPTFQFKDTSPDASDFIVLVGHAFYEPDDTVRKAFIKLIWPLYEIIVDSFREALPEIPEKVLMWRLHFIFGALSHTLHMCGSEFHSDLKEFPLDKDTNTVLELFIPFITAGIEAQ